MSAAAVARFDCPTCSTTLTVAADLVGQEVRCRACKGATTVPRPIHPRRGDARSAAHIGALAFWLRLRGGLTGLCPAQSLPQAIQFCFGPGQILA